MRRTSATKAFNGSWMVSQSINSPSVEPGPAPVWFVIHHTNCGMELFTDEIMRELVS